MVAGRRSLSRATALALTRHSPRSHAALHSLLAIGLGLGVLTLYLFASSGALDSLVAALPANRTAASADANTNATDGGGVAGAMAATAATAATAAAEATADAAAAAQEAIVALAPDDLLQLSRDARSASPTLYLVAAWASLVLTILYLLLLCLARRKIRLAVALIKEATAVVRDRPSSLAVPLGMLALQVPLVVLGGGGGMLLLVSADLDSSHFVAGANALVQPAASYVDALRAINGSGGANASRASLFADDGSREWVGPAVYAYYAFGLLWLLESLRLIGWTALSGSVSDWYFFRRDPDRRSRLPLLRSLCRVIRYHLGTSGSPPPHRQPNASCRHLEPLPPVRSHSVPDHPRQPPRALACPAPPPSRSPPRHALLPRIPRPAASCPTPCCLVSHALLPRVPRPVRAPQAPRCLERRARGGGLRHVPLALASPMPSAPNPFSSLPPPLRSPPPLPAPSTLRFR